MPAPDILQKQELNIEYVSPMALAQKGQELQSIMRGLEIFGSISQALPVMDYIHEAGLVNNIIKVLINAFLISNRVDIPVDIIIDLFYAPILSK